ncbi:caspase family protein [Burkholderia sp. PR2]|uniref:caspase family protein n=1 Tax=Burkholderia sp. PR2 TaxID=3448078 RepID=UPI00402ADE48
MKRRAIIVTYGGKANDPKYCHGVHADERMYRAFMTSPAGGSWHQDEILTLDRPSEDELRAQLAQAAVGTDYFFFAFAGHGYYSAPREETMLQINDQQFVPAFDMNNGVRKATFVFDCCRNVVSIALEERVLAKAEASRHVLNPQLCRKAFDLDVAACGSSSIVINSCDIGEEAGDSPVGGAYASRFISAAEDWATSARPASGTYQSLSVVDAHHVAEPSVKRAMFGNQNPKILAPRTPPHFPFAVAA